MLKFFQKIRQNLLKENKFSSYMLYAVGEIILVVIGILIALQINNWNEERKLKASQLSTLKQLNIDLKSNLAELNDMVESIKVYNEAGLNLLGHLEADLPPSDSLSLWVELISSSNIFNNANTTYLNIENSHRIAISDDSLRLRITLMYEQDFANVHRREQMLYDAYLPNYKKELHRTFKSGPVRYDWLEGVESRVNTPVDIVVLRKDEQYINALLELHNFRVLRIKWLQRTIDDLAILIRDIEKEIRTLESE